MATSNQFLDCLQFWNFHKTFPKFKPMPPMDAKHYLDHSYEVFGQNSTHMRPLLMIQFVYIEVQPLSNHYVPPHLSLSCAHL